MRLTSIDLEELIGKFPDRRTYEAAIVSLLDDIEKQNDRQKRVEYEQKAAHLGSLLYAEAEQDHQRLDGGYEQARLFNRENRLAGTVLDGYKDGGRSSRVDDEGRVIGSSREVIVVDRVEDSELKEMIEAAKQINQRHGNGMRAIFELSKLVYEEMHDAHAIRESKRKLAQSPGEERLLGNITIKQGLAGTCRHRSLLFQVLAAEIGINTSLVRGDMAFDEDDIPGGHAWNEVQLLNNQYLIDINNPPLGRKFGNLDYTAFMQNGGFPKIGENRTNRRYIQVDGQELYRV